MSQESKPTSPGQTERPNRRLHSRHEMGRTARATELDENGLPGAPWECELLDISRSGLGIRSRRLVQVGRVLLVELESGQSEARVLCGIVRQSRYESGQGHILGIQFRAMPRGPAIERWMCERRAA